MRLLQSIPGWLRNKYLLTGTAFLVWMLFFDSQDLITTHVRQRQELQQLEASRAYYSSETGTIREELKLLQEDPALLEKYAREKYRMKRDNEDLFIIADEVR
jgi:cell division protein DivIC